MTFCTTRDLISSTEDNIHSKYFLMQCEAKTAYQLHYQRWQYISTVYLSGRTVLNPKPILWFLALVCVSSTNYEAKTAYQLHYESWQYISTVYLSGRTVLNPKPILWFLALVCATAQQSYCHNVVVRRPSSLHPFVARPSVHRHRFLGNRQVDWQQILLAGT